MKENGRNLRVIFILRPVKARTANESLESKGRYSKNNFVFAL